MGGGGSNLSVGLTLSIRISKFDSPLTLSIKTKVKDSMMITKIFFNDPVSYQFASSYAEFENIYLYENIFWKIRPVLMSRSMNRSHKYWNMPYNLSMYTI